MSPGPAMADGAAHRLTTIGDEQEVLAPGLADAPLGDLLQDLHAVLPARVLVGEHDGVAVLGRRLTLHASLRPVALPGEPKTAMTFPRVCARTQGRSLRKAPGVCA